MSEAKALVWTLFEVVLMWSPRLLQLPDSHNIVFHTYSGETRR